MERWQFNWIFYWKSFTKYLNVLYARITNFGKWLGKSSQKSFQHMKHVIRKLNIKIQYKNFHNFQKNESWAIYLTKLLFLAQIFQWIVAQLRTNNSITTSTPNESITIQFDICSQKWILKKYPTALFKIQIQYWIQYKISFLFINHINWLDSHRLLLFIVSVLPFCRPLNRLRPKPRDSDSAQNSALILFLRIRKTFLQFPFCNLQGFTLTITQDFFDWFDKQIHH